MSSHLVQKVSEHINKDADTGILLKIVGYRTNPIDNPITFLVKYPEIVPDNFEIEISDNAAIPDIITTITQQIAYLKFNNISENICPICGKDVFYKNDATACFNMSCKTQDSGYNTLRRQLSIVFNIDNKLIEYLMHLCGISSDVNLINVLQLLIAKYHDLDSIPDQVSVKRAIDYIQHDISITSFFKACTIYDIIPSFELITTLYDDLMINALSDRSDDYQALSMLPLPMQDKLIFDSVLRVNYDLFVMCGMIKPNQSNQLLS